MKAHPKHRLAGIANKASFLALACSFTCLGSPASDLEATLLSLVTFGSASRDCSGVMTADSCMPASGLLIRRTIVDAQGVTIKNSTISFYQGSSTLIARTKTDSVGNFDVTLPMSTYSYAIRNYVSCNTPGTGTLAVASGSDIGRPVIAISDGCPYPRHFGTPQTISTLSATSPTARTIALQWTAVAKDASGIGTTTAYRIGYSTTPITSGALCQNATLYPNALTPQAPGGTETITLSSSAGLFVPATTYYFCVQAVDESDNYGLWTATVSRTTIADVVAPGTLAVSATQGGPTSINLSWTAVANDGVVVTSGAATSYEIRRAANVVFTDNSGCGTATLVTNSMVPQSLGTAEGFSTTGLNNNTDYSICVRGKDEFNNAGVWAFASAKTALNPGDTTPPASIADLKALRASSTSIQLAWSAVANDGVSAISGPAAAYEIRRATAPFSGDGGCTTAATVTNSITPQSVGAAEAFLDSGLAPDQPYYYCVRARDAANNVGLWIGLSRYVAPAGVVTTIAGNGSSGYVDATGPTARFNWPTHIRIDSGGTAFVADYGNSRIRKVATAGAVTTYPTGPALPDLPWSLALQADGSLFIGGQQRIWYVSSGGAVSAYAGRSVNHPFSDGLPEGSCYSGATFSYNWGLLPDGQGGLYFTEAEEPLVRHLSAGCTYAIAVDGYSLFPGLCRASWRGLERLPDGSLMITDTGFASGEPATVLRYSGTTLSLHSGSCSAHGLVDGGLAAARYYFPSDLATDIYGDVYVADCNNHAIRKVSATGNVSTIAGNGTSGLVDGTGSAARFNCPFSLAIDSRGFLWVADRNNHSIRQIR